MSSVCWSGRVLEICSSSKWKEINDGMTWKRPRRRVLLPRTYSSSINQRFRQTFISLTLQRFEFLTNCKIYFIWGTVLGCSLTEPVCCRISLIRNCEKLPVRDHFIVQEYLEKPFLMEGYKFDLRFYILVTSCDPLRVFLYNDGLVRMGTEKYHAPSESNLVSQEHCENVSMQIVKRYKKNTQHKLLN